MHEWKKYQQILGSDDKNNGKKGSRGQRRKLMEEIVHEERKQNGTEKNIK